MKNNKLKLWLLAILCAGASIVSAQSVSISPSATSTNGKGSYFYCMPANSTGIVFQATGANLSNGDVSGSIEQYTWTALGGIDIDGAPSGTASGTSLSSVTVKPKTGTDYSPGQYSKYAKGKLRATIRVKHSYQYQQRHCDETGVWYTDEKYEYYVNYTSEIEIRKQFSDLTGNEITGPECVKTGQRVTYSVAPWVSMYQLNTVGFDDYDWVIPPGVAQNGVLYYSADYSSVTFIVGNDFDGKTISVRMGACNPAQTPVTLTLKTEPGAPALSSGSFAQGLCIPFGAGQQTLTLTDADPSNTYIWENLNGWAATPTVTLGSNRTLTFTPQNDSRVLRLRVQGNCGEQVYDLQVNRSLSSSTNSIQNVAGGSCVLPNAPTRITLTNVAANMPVSWAVVSGESNGWKILEGTENLPQPYIMAGTGNATISATAGCGAAVTGVLMVGALPVQPALQKINTCVDAGLSGVIEVEILNYDPDLNYSPTIDDATFGTIDSDGVDANGIFKVNTTGKEGNFSVSVSASNSCGTATSAPLSYTVAKDPFTVQETPLNIPGLQISSFAILDAGYQDFDWRGDGQPLSTVIPGVVDYVTNNIVLSNYSSIYVTVTNSATGCKTRKFRTVVSGTSLFRSIATPSAVNEFTIVDIADGQNADEQLTIYPNPASTELNINMSSEGNINICIVSMSGTIVRESVNQQPNTTIDVSNLPTGNYIVVVLQGTNRYTKQLIKN